MDDLLVLLVIIGILLIIAAMRKGSSAMASKPSRLKPLVSEVDPQTTLKIIVKFAQQSGYKIDAFDEINGRIVLSDSPTGTSWGFFYPIFVSRRVDNKTLVEVGIKSKLLQVGPIVNRSHEKCINGIKAAIFANT